MSIWAYLGIVLFFLLFGKQALELIGCIMLIFIEAFYNMYRNVKTARKKNVQPRFKFSHLRPRKK